MKILSKDQIRAADRFTIENETVSSVRLMERAATACCEWLTANLQGHDTFYIFCGSGNNGGDGLALARMLYHKGYKVRIFMDTDNNAFSDDAKANFLKIREIPVVKIHDFREVAGYKFDTGAVIIDAVFGTGLNKPLQGKIREVFEEINSLPLKKIAVDIPSGLFADMPPEAGTEIFRADFTLTFQFWKRSFLHPESGVYCGNVVVLDIGISRDFISEAETPYFTSDEDLILNIYKPRSGFSHKGTFGKACIVAGSYGKIGAAVMATKAALHTGAGLTFTLAPACGYTVLQLSCPEAMFIRGGDNFISDFETEEGSVAGIGPGLGKDPATVKSFLNFLKTWENPLVLDADALNILAENPGSLSLIPKNSVITPHPKEFERLFGKTADSFQRLELAREKAAELGIFIVLKDHHTQIITPEKKVFYNITGTSGMSKGGSGDTLTGIITALLAQKYPPEQAALFGVWLHGKAGEAAAAEFSKEAMLPSDLTSNIGGVFLYLEKQKNA